MINNITMAFGDWTMEKQCYAADVFNSLRQDIQILAWIMLGGVIVIVILFWLQGGGLEWLLNKTRES